MRIETMEKLFRFLRLMNVLNKYEDFEFLKQVNSYYNFFKEKHGYKNFKNLNKFIKKSKLDFEDLTNLEEEEEYKPMESDKKYMSQKSTKEEIISSKNMVNKLLDELIDEGLISNDDIKEWILKQPLKINK